MIASKIIKRGLLVVMLLGVAGVVGTFVTYRKSFDNPEKLSALLPENTQVSMQSFEHTATRDGKTQWHLEAESASLTGKQPNKRHVMDKLPIEIRALLYEWQRSWVPAHQQPRDRGRECESGRKPGRPR